MANRYKHKKGFTLPELMVAMTVLVMVIFTATNLLVSVIRSNAENLNTLIAYGLAQEGMEGVRNIRDSNWLLGSQFDGSLKGIPVWGDVFDKSGEEKFYLIDLNALETATVEVTIPIALTDHTPWQLTAIGNDDFDGDATLIKKFVVDEQSGEFRYGHSLGLKQGDPTPFHRYVSIKKVPTDYEKPGELKKIRIASIVEWMEAGRPKMVRLDSELTDWYEGQ